MIYPKNKEIIVLANGVDENFYNSNLSFNKEFDLVFTGNMSYAPNIDATNFISKKLLPELIKSNPKIKILISGSSPSLKLQKLQNKNLLISGWVDDIRESYLKSNIFIAPMITGTGMQNKILEAMALGIPCVTTSLANNAILAENNKEIIIANDAKSMLFAIDKLQNDLDFYNLISQNAKKFILENYTWKAVNRELISILEN